MYIPPYYKENDEHKLVEFMQANSFATLINAYNNNIRATHLPFMIEKRNEQIFLVTHMAKANPQWKEFSQQELLVIFQGPHAYISPSHYEKKQNVPTWNYIAVHAYGKATLLEEDEKAITVLEAMIKTYEPAYYEQWKQLAPEYINGMLKGIMSFEIEVTRLEGKFKLSQNKTKNEQEHIITTFEKGDDPLAKGISSEMKKNL
ncbi:MAG TPA: FMN-binding negative transcriptional regulator [Bacteroidia bacterium]|jgi:transcriptional regulator